MPNKSYALEWLTIAKRNLETAILLDEVNHYADIIAIEAQQSIEKSLKSLLAFQNRKIPKSHDLGEIASLLEDVKDFTDDDKIMLEKATDFYKENRYPNPRYALPAREEVQGVLEFAKELYEQVAELIENGK